MPLNALRACAEKMRLLWKPSIRLIGRPRLPPVPNRRSNRCAVAFFIAPGLGAPHDVGFDEIGIIDDSCSRLANRTLAERIRARIGAKSSHFCNVLTPRTLGFSSTLSA